MCRTCWHDRGLMQPRFVISQTKADGSIKNRCIDNFSWAPGRGQQEESVNGYTCPEEKHSHHRLDRLIAGECTGQAGRKCAHVHIEGMRTLKNGTGKMPGIWKADIDSAFRRIPIKPSHRWAAAVAFQAKGKVC